MRNPFIPAVAVAEDRLAFIVGTRGGSAWLLAGGLFWAVAGLSAHLLVLMWVQLDYSYFLAAVAKGVVASLFGFAFLHLAPAGVGAASAAVSLIAGWSVARDAPHAFRWYSQAPRGPG
jgi:hypothetical protein